MRKYKENPLPVIETGLQFMSGVNPMPASAVQFQVNWLSNRLFMVKAAQDIPNVNIVGSERTMLVDADTGESRQLIEPGWILTCFNPKWGIGSIRPSPFKLTLPYKGLDQDDWQYRWVRVDPDGTVTRIPDVPELSPRSCLPRDGYPKGWAYAPLREEHGYVQIVAPNKKEALDDRAVYVRPGMPPIKLDNVYPGEVNTGRDQWLEYAQKYQLTYYDPHGVSSTDKRLAGSTWNGRPYDLTPFRLMSLDGTIEEMPYPTVIYDYGLKGVGYFLFTPVGLLITPNTSMFLLNGERLIRVWGQPSGWFHTPQHVFGMKLAPNGCKVAFARTANWKPDTHKPIAILDLCSGK